MTAIGGETLENSGVQDLRDVTQVAPSFSMGSGQSQTTGTIARIRGIGTSSDGPGFEAAVGIFIDGVYRARAGAALADLPELERVEVLRGPQGTLFGRNTSAGAISVITAGPDFDPGMYIESSFGFDDLEEVGARGGVNIPVGDALAFRFDGTVRVRDRYVTDIISGDDINTRDRSTMRGQMLWDISPDASLRVIADAAETDEVCCGVTPLAYGPLQSEVIAGLTGGVGMPAVDLEGRGMTVTPGRTFAERSDEEGISAELNWDLGFANFTSITAQRNWEATRDSDVDYNVIDIAYRDGNFVSFDNFTQEFRLQGEAGRINWLVGMFYGDEQLDTTERIRIGADANLFINTTVDAALTAVGLCGRRRPHRLLPDSVQLDDRGSCRTSRAENRAPLGRGVFRRLHIHSKARAGIGRDRGGLHLVIGAVSRGRVAVPSRRGRALAIGRVLRAGDSCLLAGYAGGCLDL